MSTPLARCEWCGDDVWDDQDRFVNGSYHWHGECHEANRGALDGATHNGGPLPLHNRPDGTPCNYAAMTKPDGQWVCTKCGAGGSANGGSDG